MKPPLGSFTPISLANLYAWYKSDVGVTHVTSGADQLATAWADQSGVSGITLTKTGSGQIIYGADTLNGIPTLDFTGGGYLTATMALGGTQLSMWAVFKEDATGSGRIMAYASSGTDTSADGCIPVFYPNDTTVNAYSNGVKSTSAIVKGVYSRIASVFNGSTSTVYVNEVSGGAVASTNTFGASGTVMISTSSPGTGNDLTGDLVELIIVKGAMTTSDLSNLAAYCLAKWGF